MSNCLLFFSCDTRRKNTEPPPSSVGGFLRPQYNYINLSASFSGRLSLGFVWMNTSASDTNQIWHSAIFIDLRNAQIGREKKKKENDSHRTRTIKCVPESLGHIRLVIINVQTSHPSQITAQLPNLTLWFSLLRFLPASSELARNEIPLRPPCVYTWGICRFCVSRFSLFVFFNYHFIRFNHFN